MIHFLQEEKIKEEDEGMFGLFLIIIKNKAVNQIYIP